MPTDVENTQKTRPESITLLKRMILGFVYWAVAICILIGAIFLVLQATAPKEINPSPTPNLTATLQQALSLALGPPTQTPSPTRTPPPTETPTITRTPLPTFTPTITETHTPTPTITPTPLLPMLTPGLPNEEKIAYRLSTWSPDQYDYAIHLLEGYPETLPGGKQNENYFSSFYYASLMQSEAILNYPNDPMAERWRWRLAYNLAQIGDERATQHYANLITQALNEAKTSLRDLPKWIRSQDFRLTPVKTPGNSSGNQTGYLLKLKTPGGNIYFWLVQSEGVFTGFPLSSEVNFEIPKRSDVLWSDLTADGLDELIVVNTNANSQDISFPRVFNLAQTPPNELFFRPDQKIEVGLENEHHWEAIQDSAGNDGLIFTASVYPPCPMTVSITYTWKNPWVARALADYAVQANASLAKYCELLVDQVSSVWGPQAAIPIMEKLLPNWPPAVTTEGKPYPLDEYDEWRYRLGVYYALIGDFEKAADYFQEIIDSPVIPTSRWVKPAQDFLKGYQTPAGLYKACVRSQFCNPRIALQNWVASLPKDETKNALYHLGYGGVDFRFTDRFDFEGDSTPERWFTFRHKPTSRLEFWIILETGEGAQAIFVDTVEKNQPTLTRYTTYDGETYVWLGSQQAFRLDRFPDTEKVSIQLLPPSYFYADLTNQISKNSLEALLSGFYAPDIRNELIAHHKSYNFTCKGVEDCARYQYAIGLACQLTGIDDCALDAYLKLWLDYFNSPYTTIARLKLAYKPGYGPPETPTSTPTPTLTFTPTSTWTPTLSPTATASSTPTVSSTPTMTHTQDPNKTYTPTPSTTPTPTASQTPTPTNTGVTYP